MQEVIRAQVDKVASAAHEKQQRMAAVMREREHSLKEQLEDAVAKAAHLQHQLAEAQQAQEAGAMELQKQKHEADAATQDAAAQAKLQDGKIQDLAGRVADLTDETTSLRESLTLSERARRAVEAQAAHLYVRPLLGFLGGAHVVRGALCIRWTWQQERTRA